MPTLQEHLDDLDRMVDGGADKPKIRHQIDLIGRIVATNEAERSRVAQEYADFKEATAKKIADLQAENQALVAKYEKLNAPSDNSCMSAPIVGEVDLSTD
jgi:hypothetical protein